MSVLEVEERDYFLSGTKRKVSATLISPCSPFFTFHIMYEKL